MKKSSNTFIILLATILISFGVYLYFAHSPVAGADDENPIASSVGDTSLGLDTSDNQIAQDTAFLATLTSLTVIKIDTSLFTNAAFTSLDDNQVAIEQIAPGRVNPFASIKASDGGTTTSYVETAQATNITSTSATLNGTTSTNATTSYFQYGTGGALNKTTAPAAASLVGTFNVKITGLTPKTEYSFHSVSKIGGTLTYGETLTFTTN